jgi:hypothetical protein
MIWQNRVFSIRIVSDRVAGHNSVEKKVSCQVLLYNLWVANSGFVLFVSSAVFVADLKETANAVFYKISIL